MLFYDVDLITKRLHGNASSGVADGVDHSYYLSVWMWVIDVSNVKKIEIEEINFIGFVRFMSPEIFQMLTVYQNDDNEAKNAG